MWTAPTDVRLRAALALLAGAVAGCSTTGVRPTVRLDTAEMLPPLPGGIADSVTSRRLGQGLVLHHLVRNDEPLRVDVLDVDLTACLRVRAMKGGPTAVGRATTSAMLERALVHDRSVAAAVNADFFTFTPPGVPVGALVEDWRTISGPIERPVLAFDSRYLPYIGPLTVTTTVTGRHGVTTATAWNRPRARITGIIDAAWAQPLDTIARATARQLVPLADGSGETRRFIVRALPPAHSGVALGDTLLITGPATAALIEGDPVVLATSWAPIRPWQAVGGFPLLLRDSVPSPTLAGDGAESFRGRNPRTAAGTSRDGGRLFLVVIDGRRPGFSVGTTTRETADLLRALGAVDAINLDGGGSSVLVVRDSGSAPIHIVNRPSDAAGERPVGDALMVAASCVHGVPPRRQPPSASVP